MPTPLPELLAAVPGLNAAGVPIVYTVEGDAIVGRWDVVNAQTLYPNEFATIDRDFSVTVELDERKGTYTSKDRDSRTESSVRRNGFSFGTSTFSGKKIGKEFHLSGPGLASTPDGLQPGLVWSFDSARIKDPLFAFLEQHGWTRKRGLFG